ncbi:hypothetical protein [Gracilibacillus thailandensis]|nr:hypothetical protein [Gracilibacillus thailandensis]
MQKEEPMTYLIGQKKKGLSFCEKAIFAALLNFNTFNISNK